LKSFYRAVIVNKTAEKRDHEDENTEPERVPESLKICEQINDSTPGKKEAYQPPCIF